LARNYKSFNARFGKIGRFASADAIIHLLNVKRLPLLLYGLNDCAVSVSDNKLHDFAIFKTLAIIFETFSQDVLSVGKNAKNKYLDALLSM
jgi:hypothetical protein